MVVNRVWVRVDLVHVFGAFSFLRRVAFMLTYHDSPFLVRPALWTWESVSVWVMQISSCLKCRCTVRLQHNIRGIQSPSLISSVFQLFFFFRLWERVLPTLFFFFFFRTTSNTRLVLSASARFPTTARVSLLVLSPLPLRTLVMPTRLPLDLTVLRLTMVPNSWRYALCPELSID